MKKKTLKAPHKRQFYHAPYILIIISKHLNRGVDTFIFMFILFIQPAKATVKYPFALSFVSNFVYLSFNGKV